MRKLILFLAAVFSADACATAADSVLPSGTYHYEARDGSEVTMKSVVTVSRDATGVVVRETADRGDEPVSVTRRLDAATFSLRSYEYQGACNPAITVSSDKAVFCLKEGKTATLDAPLPGKPASLVDFLVSSFAILPAMLHAGGATSFNTYSYYVMSGAPTVDVSEVVNTTAARPATVGKDDVPLSIRERGDEKVLTMWYDPKSFVLHYVDLGDNIGIVLTK